MGGMHGFGRVRSPGDDVSFHERWEPRAQMLGILAKPLGAGMRSQIEQLPPADYLAGDYYVRWLLAAERMNVVSGRLSADDLVRWRQYFESNPGAKVPRHDVPELAARVVARMSGGRPLPAAGHPAFRVGDGVIVRRMHPEAHNRCPRYVRGVSGVIEAICGDDEEPGPERGAGEVTAVYTVRFNSRDVWGDQKEPPFLLHVDLWEIYLEASA